MLRFEILRTCVRGGGLCVAVVQFRQRVFGRWDDRVDSVLAVNRGQFAPLATDHKAEQRRLAKTRFPRGNKRPGFPVAFAFAGQSGQRLCSQNH